MLRGRADEVSSGRSAWQGGCRRLRLTYPERECHLVHDPASLARVQPWVRAVAGV